MVEAYILIQIEVGKAAEVAHEIGTIDGVTSSEAVTGPYDAIVHAQAADVDSLGKLVVARIQAVDGITRTLTCPIIRLWADGGPAEGSGQGRAHQLVAELPVGHPRGLPHLGESGDRGEARHRVDLIEQEPAASLFEEEVDPRQPAALV